MSGTSLPHQDHVARYCKPSAMGTEGLPRAAAFELGERVSSLSDSRLPSFGAPREPESTCHPISWSNDQGQPHISQVENLQSHQK